MHFTKIHLRSTYTAASHFGLIYTSVSIGRGKKFSCIVEQVKLEDENDVIKGKLAQGLDRLEEGLTDERKRREEDVNKVQRDMDDLHDSTLATINGVKTDLAGKVEDNEKRMTGKLEAFKSDVLEGQKSLESLIAGGKDDLEKRLQDEIDGRKGESEAIRNQLESDVKGLHLSVEDGHSKLFATIDEEKSARGKMINELTNKVDSGLQGRILYNFFVITDAINKLLKDSLCENKTNTRPNLGLTDLEKKGEMRYRQRQKINF